MQDVGGGYEYVQKKKVRNVVISHAVIQMKRGQNRE
jgi:hypothetical protein